MNTSFLHRGLVKAADVFVQRMKNRLSSSDYPHKDESGRGYTSIEESIVIGQVQESATGMSITITVGGPRAPFAVAFEYGSGEHGEKGETYPITPKNARALAFVWEKHENSPPWGSPKFIGIVPGSGSEKPIFMFRYVDHPGIEATPYVRPSIDESMAEIKAILGREFKYQILRSWEQKFNGTP